MEEASLEEAAAEEVPEAQQEAEGMEVTLEEEMPLEEACRVRQTSAPCWRRPWRSLRCPPCSGSPGSFVIA